MRIILLLLISVSAYSQKYTKVLNQVTLPVNVQYNIPSIYEKYVYLIDIVRPELHSITVNTVSPAYVIPTKVGVDTFDMFRSDTLFRLPIKIQ
jgi:hypothetical protein